MEVFNYRNRAGENVEFTYNGDGSSATITSPTSFIKTGNLKEDGKISFIYPNDGPFIFVGMDFNDIIYNGNLDLFLKDEFRRTVIRIDKDLLGITIIFNKENKLKKK